MPPITLLRQSYMLDEADDEPQPRRSSDTADDEAGVTRLRCMTWSFHDPSSHESCIVALYILRSLRVQLAELSPPPHASSSHNTTTINGSNEEDDDGSCGVEWELTYLPASDEMASRTCGACRTAFRFDGVTADRSTREGLSGVVFLSARAVCLYTGSVSSSSSSGVAQGECALDLFSVAHDDETAGWQRRVAALVLPSNRPRTNNRDEVRLLHVSAMPSSSSADTTGVVYALAYPSAATHAKTAGRTQETLYDVVFGVVTAHCESDGHAVSSQLRHILTDHRVHFVFPLHLHNEPDKTDATQLAVCARPWQCRWLFVPDVRAALQGAEEGSVAGVLLGLVDGNSDAAARAASNTDASNRAQTGRLLRVHCAGFRADEAEPVLGVSASQRITHCDTEEESMFDMDHSLDDTTYDAMPCDAPGPFRAGQRLLVTFTAVGAPTTRLSSDIEHIATTTTTTAEGAAHTTQAEIRTVDTPQGWVLRLVCDFLQPAQRSARTLPPTQGLYLTDTSLDQVSGPSATTVCGRGDVMHVCDANTRWCGLVPVQLPSYTVHEGTEDRLTAAPMPSSSLTGFCVGNEEEEELEDSMRGTQQDYSPVSPCTPLRLIQVNTCKRKGDADSVVVCCAFARQPAALTHQAALYVAQLTRSTLLLQQSSAEDEVQDDTCTEANALLCLSPCRSTAHSVRTTGVAEWLARVALRCTRASAQGVARRVVQLQWKCCVALAGPDVHAALAALEHTVVHELPWKAYSKAPGRRLEDYVSAVWAHAVQEEDMALYSWAVHTLHACFLQLLQHVDWLAVSGEERRTMRELVLCYLGLLPLQAPQEEDNDESDEASDAAWLCMQVLLRVSAQGEASAAPVSDEAGQQWRRRMLLLYASRRVDATLELLLEDICQPAPHSQGSAMMEGMEYALLSSLDEAALYDAVHTLARSQLPLADLAALCCTWHAATLQSVAPTTLPSLPLLPLVIDLARQQQEDVEHDKEGHNGRREAESVIVRLLNKWEGSKYDGDAHDPTTATIRPLCLPAFLLRDGVPWLSLSRFPFAALRAETCVLLFFHVVERWARHVAAASAATNGDEEGEEEDVVCALWQRHAGQCHRLREAVHAWRWFSGLDKGGGTGACTATTTVASFVMQSVRTWHMCAASRREAAGTEAIADFAVLLHLRPCTFLVRKDDESSCSSDDDGDDDDDAIEGQQRLMRFVHRVFACSTSRLLACLAERCVSEAQQPQSPEHSGALQQQLVDLYIAAQGEGKSAVGRDESNVIHTQVVTTHNVSSRMLCALWEHMWRDDAEAVTNAVLYDKLLEAAATLHTQCTQGAMPSAAALLLALMRPICLYCYPVLMPAMQCEQSASDAMAADETALYKQYDELTCTPHSSNIGGVNDDVRCCTLAQVRSQAASAVLRSLAFFEPDSSTTDDVAVAPAAASLCCLRRLLALLPVDSAAVVVRPHARSSSARSATQSALTSARASRPPSAAPAKATRSPRSAALQGHSARLATEASAAEATASAAAEEEREEDVRAAQALQGWSLSPMASYFVALHGLMSGTDMTHMVLVAEVLRRELCGFVRRALGQLGYAEQDSCEPARCSHRTRYTATERFEAREVLNTMVEGMEGGIEALRRGGGALYEPLLLLLYLECMHRLCAGEDEKSSGEGDEGAVWCAGAVRNALERCIGIIAQRTLAPLSADAHRKLRGLLREDFYERYCGTGQDGTADVVQSDVSYEQSAVHHRMRAEVFAALQALRDTVLQDSMDRELATACGLHDMLSEDSVRATTENGDEEGRSVSNSADAEAGLMESGGGNFLAHTLLSRLTEHIAPTPQPQQIQAPAVETMSNVPAVPRMTSHTANDRAAEMQQDMSLLVKEEAVRRRQLQGAALQAHRHFLTSDPAFLHALATLYLAMRCERRRRELLGHVAEQKDLIFTFSSLWLRQLQERQRHTGRQLALAAAEALQRQWRLLLRQEREQRTGIEALAGAVRALLATQHQEQVRLCEREWQTRSALVQLEEQLREWAMGEVSRVLRRLAQQQRSTEGATDADRVKVMQGSTPEVQQRQHIRSAGNQYSSEAALVQSAGLAYVNEAKDNLWSALSKLHNKFRDTVAPAPPERTRPQPHRTQPLVSPPPLSSLPPETAWQPPRAAPVLQDTQDAGWEWNDEEEEKKKEKEEKTEEMTHGEVAEARRTEPVVALRDHTQGIPTSNTHSTQEESKNAEEERPKAVTLAPAPRVPHPRVRRATRRAPLATVIDTTAVQEVPEGHAAAAKPEVPAALPPLLPTRPPDVPHAVMHEGLSEAKPSVYDAIDEAVAAASSVEAKSATHDECSVQHARPDELYGEVAAQWAATEAQARDEVSAAEAQAWRVLRLNEVYHGELIARRYALMH